MDRVARQPLKLAAVSFGCAVLLLGCIVMAIAVGGTWAEHQQVTGGATADADAAGVDAAADAASPPDAGLPTP
ncbi:MAG TPA: hypothetical protein RMH85_35130 [Polyangiaceae bacterium LLY-WYZ-15_(1-7)]|nr:hypothetical protein [Myxococcales bacterium]MAT27327.1 hypothetical protein [Sandaracinus sp.]HJK92848.1 hypothetical protein [Polyangiaceae bacterium LLY-WYZ-15_(1-7)]MBJ74063.1 hypothetical protein [Sandaracinus sp.]HJL06559.1 hypothetical protein [Polyangiaceae bacterium LLY-WYZ-15_(1-7)]